jgi:hypothetical protein
LHSGAGKRKRTVRDEAWRRQEAYKFDCGASKRASAAVCGSAILAYLEKITGESIALPPPDTASGDVMSHDAAAIKELVPYDDNGSDTAPDSGGNVGSLHRSALRWPKHDVEALGVDGAGGAV